MRVSLDVQSCDSKKLSKEASGNYVSYQSPREGLGRQVCGCCSELQELMAPELGLVGLLHLHSGSTIKDS